MTLKFGVRVLAAGFALACATSVAVAADTGKVADTLTTESRQTQEASGTETSVAVASNYATENSSPMGLERMPPLYAQPPKSRKVAVERPANTARRYPIFHGITY